MSELFNEMNGQMVVLAAPVQYWMNWMMLIFVLSLAFVRNHFPARIALLAMFVSMPLAMLVFYLTRNVHVLGIVHFILWLPLLIFIYKHESKNSNFQFKSVYGVWLSLLVITILVSLIFDTRDLFLIALGRK